MGRDIDKNTARHSTQPAVEWREIAKAGERKREEEAVIGRHADVCVALQIVLLIFERKAAALRVVERRDPFLDEARMEDVVVEGVVRAVLVRQRVRVGGQAHRIIALRRVVEASQLRDEELAAPGG